MSGEVKYERISNLSGDKFLVFVKDYESGSSTSFGASSEWEALKDALTWFGIEVVQVVKKRESEGVASESE